MKDTAAVQLGYAKALACMEACRHDEALGLLDDLLSHGRRDGDIYFARAMAYLSTGRYRKAGCDLLRTIVMDRSHQEAWRYLAFIQLTLGKVEGALKSIETALSLDALSVESWCVLGDIQLDLGEYDAAKEAFDKALSLAPQNPEPHCKMAMYHISRGDMQGLRQEYELLKEMNPEMASQIGGLFFDADSSIS